MDEAADRSETLTGAPAAAYVQAWMGAAKHDGGLNARRVTADALAARLSRRALVRLRFACVFVRRLAGRGVGASRRVRVRTRSAAARPGLTLALAAGKPRPPEAA